MKLSFKPGFKKIWKQNPNRAGLTLLFYTILLLLPFHTFLTTWASSAIGNEEVLKAWKEIALALALPFAAWELKKDKKLRKKIFSRRVNQLILAYATLHLLIWAITRPELDAAVAGLLFNLRFLAYFVLAQLIVGFWPKFELIKTALNIMFVGLAGVALFGTLQTFILPDDVLTHFGYGKDTVKPFLRTDSREGFIRINSLMRGPNPLGAYIMFATTIGLAAWSRFSSWRRNLLFLLPFVLITLYSTSSRSAVVGLSIALVIYFVRLFWQNERWRKTMLIAVSAFLVLAPITVYAVKDTQFFQIRVLHNDLNDGRNTSSDESRVEAYQRALDDIADHPFGEGPGTAGHASNYNSEVTRFSENYYLQITQEVGIAGVILLLAICFELLRKLWQLPINGLNTAMFATLVGFMVINLFLHAWGDDASTMTWWGLAGLVLAKEGKTRL